MNKAKKGFLIAGSILSLVAVVFAMFFSLGMSLVNMVITEDFMLETYLEDPYFEVVEDIDGSYTIYDEDGYVVFTDEDISIVVELAHDIINGFNFFNISIAIAAAIFAIRLLVKVAKGKCTKGSIIVLLVLTALQMNLLATVFMIIALCKKDHKAEEENPDIQLPTEDITYVS